MDTLKLFASEPEYAVILSERSESKDLRFARSATQASRGKKGSRSMEKRQEETYREVVRIENSSSQEMEIWIEPWGDRLIIPSQAIYEFAGEGPLGDGLRVEFRDGSPAIHGWPGSILKIYKDDVLLRNYPIRVPQVPFGMRT